MPFQGRAQVGESSYRSSREHWCGARASARNCFDRSGLGIPLAHCSCTRCLTAALTRFTNWLMDCSAFPPFRITSPSHLHTWQKAD
jgi:hypothetical protein